MAHDLTVAPVRYDEVTKPLNSEHESFLDFCQMKKPGSGKQNVTTATAISRRYFIHCTPRPDFIVGLYL
ncbi:hypothetical protein FAI40_01540 [Acetobacteraceae bacterium]|nr:hypothetical protein FAI40_01540 [Acetobacteraceae bacterium]